MSADIQAADLSFTARDKNQEIQVEIYENADTLTQSPADPRPLRVRPRPQNKRAALQRSPFGVNEVILGVLLLLIFAGIYTRYILASLDKQSLFAERHQLNITLNQAKTRILNLTEEGEHLKSLRNQTKGWTLCYYISTERRNWTESRRDCLSRGADLLVINSIEEQSFIRHLNDTEDAWIGLRSVRQDQRGKKPEWKWVDGSEAEFQAWGMGVDTNTANDSAAFLSPEGGWNHTTDGSKHWICEKHI